MFDTHFVFYSLIRGWIILAYLLNWFFFFRFRIRFITLASFQQITIRCWSSIFFRLCRFYAFFYFILHLRISLFSLFSLNFLSFSCLSWLIKFHLFLLLCGLFLIFNNFPFIIFNLVPFDVDRSLNAVEDAYIWEIWILNFLLIAANERIHIMILIWLKFHHKNVLNLVI